MENVASRSWADTAAAADDDDDNGNDDRRDSWNLVFDERSK
jgi:hypothetical protein